MHLTTQILLLFLCFTAGLSAQTDTVSTPPVPRVEVRELALHYINLDWTKAQWDSLSGNVMELSLYVDEIGEPYLQSARGFESPAVFDRLVAATNTLTYFHPAERNGSFVGAEYTLWVIFPAAGTGIFHPSLLYEPPPVITEDSLAENYLSARNVLFFDFNLLYNHFTGAPGRYLKNGFGMDLAFGGRWSDHLGAGLILGVELNDRHQPFPEDPYPDRDEISSGVLIGGLLDYNLAIPERSYLSLRTELAYGVLNAANRLDPDEEEGWVQYRGLHTGLVLQYTLRIGKHKLSPTFNPAIVTTSYSAVNVLTGIRYRYYGDRVGTGTYYFIGLGYRVGGDTFQSRSR